MWTAERQAARASYASIGKELENELVRARHRREPSAAPFRVLSSTDLFSAALAGDDFAASAAAVEGLLHGARDAGLASAVIIHHGVCSIVGRFGSPALAERFRRDGLVGPCSVAMTEAHGGSAAFEMTTRLVRDGAMLRLQGEKWHITNAPLAPALVVFARDEEVGRPSAVLVDRRAEGVAVEPLSPCGMRSAAVGRIRFDTAVREDAIVGARGEGVTIFQEATVREKILLAFATAGIVERVLDDMLDFAHTRAPAGAPLASFQYVRRRITEAHIRLEAARGLSHLALARWLQGEECGVESSTAKLYAAETGLEIGVHAMKLFGSHGFEDGGLSDIVLGAIGASLGGGSEEAQREIIYKGLYLRKRRRAQGSGGRS